jgi:cytochrome c peroxidase
MAALLAGWGSRRCAAQTATNPQASSRPAAPRLEPLPEKVPQLDDTPQTRAAVALGRQLFFDPRLSGNNQMSCATCHQPHRAFTDGLARAQGDGGRTLARNTPTVLNTAWLPVLFWDGRASSLEEQALRPIESPDEMNQPLDDLVDELRAIPHYVRAFQEAFGAEISRDTIARALAAYQRTLVSRNAPLDRYLRGDREALSPQAIRGMELFTGEAGCIRCHNGPLLSDGKFYRLGVAFDDEGHGAVTGKADDRYKFRTPSLRDVARTAPYMHNGSQRTLFDVVEFYLREVPPSGPDGLPIDVQPQLGLSFSDIEAIVRFLESLSGELPDERPPPLPPGP